MKTKQEVIIKFDLLSILKVVLLFVGLVFLFKVYELLLGLYIAFIIASIIRPLLSLLQRITKNKVNRGLLALVIYVILLIFLIFIFTNVLSSLLSQFINLLQTISYEKKIATLFAELKNNRLLGPLFSEIDINTAITYTQNLVLRTVTISNTLKGAQSVAGTIPSLVYVLLASWYFLVDRDNILASLLLPIRDRKLKHKINKLVLQIEQKLGKWAVAQVLLMLIIGLLTYIVLLLLGVQYAGGLAIIAGLLEIIPTIGPLLSVIPAIFVVILTKGFGMAIVVAIAYFLIQQAENSIIVPKVMQQAVGLHPLVVILSIAIGQIFAGVSGALLAVPTLAIFSIVMNQTSVWHNSTSSKENSSKKK